MTDYSPLQTVTSSLQLWHLRSQDSIWNSSEVNLSSGSGAVKQTSAALAVAQFEDPWN